MSYRPLFTYDVAIGAKAFGKSSVIGALSGVCLLFILQTPAAIVTPSDLWLIPVWGLMAMPFVGLGLAIFGLPVTIILRSQAHKHWVGMVAIVWGAMAGKISFYAINHGIFGGDYRLDKVESVDLGLIFGIPTGIAWWVLRRQDYMNDLD